MSDSIFAFAPPLPAALLALGTSLSMKNIRVLQSSCRVRIATPCLPVTTARATCGTFKTVQWSLCSSKSSMQFRSLWPMTIFTKLAATARSLGLPYILSVAQDSPSAASVMSNRVREACSSRRFVVAPCPITNATSICVANRSRKDGRKGRKEERRKERKSPRGDLVCGVLHLKRNI